MTRQGNTAGSPESAQAQRVLLAAYLLHLLGPLYLFLDIVFSWRLGYISLGLLQPETVIASICFVWLVAGLGAIFFSRDRKVFVRRISKPLMSIYALYSVLVVAELLCRWAFGPMLPIGTVWPPGGQWMLEVQPGLFPGVRGGIKRFTTNDVGLRGVSPRGLEGAYKIVTVGGSTTECLWLDDSETWPSLLMQELNARQSRRKVWVGNAGLSGMNTVNHLLFLQNMPVFKQADMLIFLIGFNDLHATLAFEGQPTQDVLERVALEVLRQKTGFAHAQRPFPLYRRLYLFPILRKGYTALLHRSPRSRGDTPWFDDVPALRRKRSEARVAALPDLQTGTEEYRGRVRALAQECRALVVRCLYLTQPVLWRNDLTPAEQRLLWGGNVGRKEKVKGYASAEDLARAMDAFNQALLDVCVQDRLECLDLAARVPKKTSEFFDDDHFTEAGARDVAHDVADFLLSTPPLAER